MSSITQVGAAVPEDKVGFGRYILGFFLTALLGVLIVFVFRNNADKWLGIKIDFVLWAIGVVATVVVLAA